ncbi:MAG: hypothetical protein U7123_22465 [Potamolinea sp.]
MNLGRIISGLVVGAALISTASDVQAQNRRPSRVASLGEMGCQSLSNIVGYKPVNGDVTIGRQIFRAVAYLDGQAWGFLSGRGGISPDHTAGVACRLSAPNQTPRFRTLTLAFGFADNSEKIDYIRPNASTELRLSVYKDGNLYGSQSIRPGDMLRWPIDVRNARSISLEANCIKGGNSTSYAGNPEVCPVLYFFQDTLQ